MEDRATQLRKQEEERKKKKLAEAKLKSLRNEMNGKYFLFFDSFVIVINYFCSPIEVKPEIENLEKSLESCLQILIPTPEQFFISEGSEEINFDDHLELSGPSTETAGELFCWNLKIIDFFHSISNFT